jgi:hypothetical protein
VVDSVNAFLPAPLYKTEINGIKIATPDIVLDDPQLAEDTMVDYVFAAIGGTEILSASRSDLINSPLNNGYTVLADAGQTFRKRQSIIFTEVSENIFNSFGIESSEFLLENAGDVVTSNSTTGIITISLNGVKDRYFIDVEIINNLQEINGTI